MKKIDRLKELEKIAEKLGIGLNKDVVCVGCGKELKLNKAVVITNGKRVTYLCKDCNKKLESGELEKKPGIGGIDDKLLEKLKKLREPVPGDSLPRDIYPVPWQPYKPEPLPTGPYISPTTDRYYRNTDYIVSHMNNDAVDFYKIEPNYANQTDKGTER